MAFALFVALLVTFLSSTAAAFRVFPGTATQCDTFQVQFNGSTAVPPFTFLALPIGARAPVSIPVPDSAWDGNTMSGRFETVLPFPANTQFLVVMDDAAGLGTGGVSDVLTVQPSGNASCIPFQDNPNGNGGNNGGGGGGPPPNPPSRLLSFSPSVPTQCSQMVVSWPATTTGRPTLRGFVPFGTAFSIITQGDSQATSTSWTLNVAAGSQFMLALQDQSGNIIDNTPLLTVAGDANTDSSCLNADCPQVTVSLTVNSAATPTSSELPMNSGPGLKVEIGVIVACVSVALIILGVLVFWFFKRRRHVRSVPLLPTDTSSIGSTPSSSATHFKGGISAPVITTSLISGISTPVINTSLISSPLYNNNSPTMASPAIPKRPDRRGTNLLSFVPPSRTIGDPTTPISTATLSPISAGGAAGGRSPTAAVVPPLPKDKKPRPNMPVSPSASITSFGDRGSAMGLGGYPILTVPAPAAAPRPSPLGPSGGRPKSPGGAAALEPATPSQGRKKLVRPSTAENAARPTTPLTRSRSITNNNNARPGTAQARVASPELEEEKPVRIKYLDLGEPGRLDPRKLSAVIHEAEERALRSQSPL